MPHYQLHVHHAYFTPNDNEYNIKYNEKISVDPYFSCYVAV